MSFSSHDDDIEVVYERIGSSGKRKLSEKNTEPAQLNVADVLKKAKLDKDLCDVSIRKGRKWYHVHSLVLKLAIPYFRTATETRVGNGQRVRIDLTNAPVTHETLKAILSYAYGEKISEDLPLIPLHEAADFFGLDDLAKDCVEKMWNVKIDLDDFLETFDLVLSIMKYAKRGFEGSQNLLKSCLDQIHAYLFVGYASDEFRNLSLSDVVTVLSHENADIRIERDCCMIAAYWMSMRINERAKDAKALFRCIDWERLDPEEIRGRTHYQWFFLENEQCRAVHDLFKTCLEGSESLRDQLLGEDRAKNRHSLKQPVVLAFNPQTSQMHTFTLRSQNRSFIAWKHSVFRVKRSRRGERVTFLAVCADDSGNAYIWCENKKDESIHHSLLIKPFHGGTTSVRTLPQILPQADASICGFSDRKCVVWKDRVYFLISDDCSGTGKQGSLFVCGVNLKDSRDVLYMCCPHTDWKPTPTGTPYRLHLVDGHVLVSSDYYSLAPARIDLSFTGSKRSNEIFSWWNRNYEPGRPALTKYRNRIYMVGDGKHAEYYDEDSKEWNLLPDLNFERSNPILVAADDKLFVFNASSNEDPPMLAFLAFEWLDLRSQDPIWQSAALNLHQPYPAQVNFQNEIFVIAV